MNEYVEAIPEKGLLSSSKCLGNKHKEVSRSATEISFDVYIKKERTRAASGL